MNELSHGATEHLTQATSGLDGGSLRRIFHRLGYDYADDFLPSLPADSLAAQYVCRRPHRIASAFGKQFSVLWFSVSASSEDAFRPAWSEAERALLAWAWGRYPHGLILFSDPTGVYWRVACSASANAVFAFDVSDVTRQVKTVWEQWAIDDADEWTTESGAIGLLEHGQKCAAACQSAALRPILPAQASTRAARETARTAAHDKKADAEDGSGTALGSYLPRLTRAPLLTASEEAELLRLARTGDQKARTQLIEANTRLVFTIARSYLHSQIPLEDLMQEGVIGLIHALEKYEVSYGYRFSTYATYWIRQACGRAVENSSRVIRVPAHLHETRNQIWKVLENCVGYEENIAFIASQTGLPPEKVGIALEAFQPVLSLDSEIGEGRTISLMDSSAFVDKNAAPSNRIFCRALKEEIKYAMTHLTPREREVLTLRYGLTEASGEPMTLEQIGKALHLSRERARQIEAGALQKLRRGDVGGRLRDTVHS